MKILGLVFLALNNKKRILYHFRDHHPLKFYKDKRVYIIFPVTLLHCKICNLFGLTSFWQFLKIEFSWITSWAKHHQFKQTHFRRLSFLTHFLELLCTRYWYYRFLNLLRKYDFYSTKIIRKKTSIWAILLIFRKLLFIERKHARTENVSARAKEVESYTLEDTSLH